MVHIRSLHSTLILPYLAYCVLVWGHTCGSYTAACVMVLGTHLWFEESTQHIDLVSNIP